MTLTPKTRQDLFDRLDALNINHSTVEHPPVFTVAESQGLRDQIPGGHTKNLFLKDKKGRYFLVTVEENAEVNLKTIHTLIGASGRVSFGKPEALMEKLGVAPGSVTIFSAINDPGHDVTIVIDAPLMEYDIINAHPLINEATTSIGREDLKRFLADTGHEPMILKVST
jgi:Ala-tRNA(Pro) deacylase